MPLSRLKLTWWLALLALPLGAQSTAPSRTISAELLRYPVPDKALHMLQKAIQTSGAGDHWGAIQQLEKTLAKYPSAGAYVYSLVGVEYLKTGQLTDAAHALEQAVTLLPHDASDHANLGLALVCKGQYERAKPELERALELDPHNTVAGQLLNMLGVRQERAEVKLPQ